MDRTSVAVSAATPQIEKARPTDDARPGRKRVLVIEDHIFTRLALTELLKRRGFLVDGAADAAAARKCVAAVRYDLVVSDLGLPDGDGNALMSEFSRRLGLRGIAVTGRNQPADLDLCLQAGFAACVTKPVHVKALDAALEMAFRPTAH